MLHIYNTLQKLENGILHKEMKFNVSETKTLSSGEEGTSSFLDVDVYPLGAGKTSCPLVRIHRAESTMGILIPSMVIVEVAACCDGEMAASHLTMLRARPLNSAKFFTTEISEILFLLSATLLDTNIVYMGEGPEIEHSKPHFLELSSRRTGSITSRKRSGERTEPCLTPREIGNEQEVVPQICTRDNMPVYQSFIRLHSLALMPALSIWCINTGYSRVSKVGSGQKISKHT